MWLIRKALPEDANTIVVYGEQMFHESQFAQYDFNTDKACGLVSYLIEDQDGIVLVAEDEDGNECGFILGFVEEHYFGNTRVAHDLALYVHPEFRRQSVACELIKRYEEEARKRGAQECCIGSSTGIEMERAAKLYESCGFTKYGFNFRKNIGGIQ